MANAARLETSDLPTPPPHESVATTSPARGQEMRNFLQARLLQKNRAPPLVHSWDFWHDRQDRLVPKPTGNGTSGAAGNYEDRLEVLATIDDVRKFWNVFNNFDLSRLLLRDSIHLFHKDIKPVWEDPRNTRGGSWTFRVPKAQALDFWKEVCMMAVGETLQRAVESERTTFRDDICGVSLAVRFNSMLIQVWNRDGEHEEGIGRILAAVLEGLSENLRPKNGTFYYKKHSEHAGFTGATNPGSIPQSRPISSLAAENELHEGTGMQSLNAIADGKAGA